MENPKKISKNLKPPFSKTNQPSGALKSAGWQRRIEAQKILDEFMAKGEMTLKEIEDLLVDIKKHPEKHTLREFKIAEYLNDKKNTLDWLDRHVSKAPQEHNIKSQSEITNKGIDLSKLSDEETIRLAELTNKATA